METKITKNGNQTVVSIVGRLDTLSSKDFERDLQPVLQEVNPDIVIDCRDMKYISSSGLRLFMALLKNVNSKKGKLVIRNLDEGVKEVFDTVGFSAIFDIQ
jgi:anti-anti-sigma factor